MTFQRHANYYHQTRPAHSQDWRNTFNLLSLEGMNKILTRDLPFDTSVITELMGSKQSSTQVTGNLDGSGQVFEAEGLYLYRSGAKNAYLETRKIEIAPALRGKGIGKIFLDNRVKLCEELDVSILKTRAGLTNGPVFFAMHGFNVELPLGQRQLSKVRDNLNPVEHKVSDAAKQKIQEAFEKLDTDLAEGKRGTDANRMLADLTEDIDGTPLRDILFQGVEYRAYLDLNDPDQRQAYDHAMRNIERTRQYMTGITLTSPAAIAGNPEIERTQSL